MTTTAVVFDSYGGPGVLRLTDLPGLTPGPGQVRIRVRAAGVQPFDVGVRRGDLRTRVPVTFPQRLGNEFAGVVDALGPGVAGVTLGAEVVGSTMLTGYGTHLLADPATLVPKPATLDFAQAVAFVAAVQTAAGALDELAVGPQDRLLVHAAAGSVGTIAVQLARLRGATVIGTASEANHPYLRELGATPVTYGPGLEDRVRAIGPVGVALDAAGGEAIVASVALGVPPGRIGTIVDDRTAARHGTRVVRAGRSPARLAAGMALAGAGTLRMPVRTYPLADVVAAHRVVESRHGRGKVVLLVD